jgi:hypothetical protein
MRRVKTAPEKFVPPKVSSPKSPAATPLQQLSVSASFHFTPAPPALEESVCNAWLCGFTPGENSGELSMFGVRFRNGEPDLKTVPESLRFLFGRLRKEFAKSNFEYHAAIYKVLKARNYRVETFSEGSWNDEKTVLTKANGMKAYFRPLDREPYRVVGKKGEEIK